MTEQLYLEDSYKKLANATVTTVGTDYLILNKTIFYPQGGGQPSDKGTIVSNTGSLKVKQVEYNAGNIKHIGTISGHFKEGASVALSLDWTTRLKHMQWHTAGHLVDLVVRNSYPNLIPIRGMHGIGKKLFIEYEGVHDLDSPTLKHEIDKLVNAQPTIKTQLVTLDELKRMANWLPEKLPTSKKLRILSINNTYHIPDGGTQLKTGEPIWPITVENVEKTESSTLVHYMVSTQKVESQEVNTPSISSAEIKTVVAVLNKEFEVDMAQNIDIEKIKIKYLGKNGLTTKLLQELPKLSGKDKRLYGPQLNKLKKDQEQAIADKYQLLNTANQNLLVDLTTRVPKGPAGRLHPTTVVIREMNEFFRYHGFSIGEGREIETAEYNFRRLNLPVGHPATDLQDTLFVKEPDLLMRTHTSSVETRILSTHKPPLRVVVPGKVYRNETNSLTNTSFFYQYQGFVVDKGVTLANLKDTLTKFHKFLFGNDVVLRFRYKYYPEVSPGMGVDMQCKFCGGKGCQVCKGRGYIEVLGSGMIHVNTLRACGINPEVYSGFAFGMGLDRLVMSKYGIKDIRKLYGGELAYL